MGMDFSMDKHDFEYLRALAGQVAELAARPEQSRLAEQWRLHNQLADRRPLVFCDPEHGWQEILRPELLKTASPLARQWELGLRKRIYHAEVLRDDFVVDGRFSVPILAESTGWGLQIQHIGEREGQAYRVKPVIEDYERDFPKLRYPQTVVDGPGSDRLLELAHQVFDGLLVVERRMSWWWSLGLTNHYIDLRGLENFLCDLVLEPEWVHRMMDFLCEGALGAIDWLEQQGLLYQNTGNHYVGSGGFGFTDELPPVNGRRVTPMDMWGFVESQETVSISPEMYGEFVFPYHRRIAERFGLNCFGCCEPYEGRWRYARQLPRLRRVSCSPWSDRRKMPEHLGDRYIASIKLNPSPLSRPVMDEAFVRDELRQALEYSRSCVPELIMKDNHTLGGNPRNAARWVEIAREEIDRL